MTQNMHGNKSDENQMKVGEENWICRKEQEKITGMHITIQTLGSRGYTVFFYCEGKPEHYGHTCAIVVAHATHTKCGQMWAELGQLPFFIYVSHFKRCSERDFVTDSCKCRNRPTCETTFGNLAPKLNLFTWVL